MVQNALHILVVADDSDDVESIVHSAEAGVHAARFTPARTLEAARAVLKSCRPDLIIAVLHLPDGDATELLPSDATQPSSPLLLITEQADEAAAAAALRHGACDYVVRSDRTFADLPRVVQRWLREGEAVRARRDAEEELSQSEKHNRFLASVMDRSCQPFGVGHVDGSLGIVNEAFCKLV
jgi:DNA-binding NtrC family response regulator